MIYDDTLEFDENKLWIKFEVFCRQRRVER